MSGKRFELCHYEIEPEEHSDNYFRTRGYCGAKGAKWYPEFGSCLCPEHAKLRREASDDKSY